MLIPFFAQAGQSPTRQATFRRIVGAHLLLLLGAVWLLLRSKPGASMMMLGNLLLVAGIIEGAVLVGWRLTQMPKSQALEFLLVSPLRPRRLYLAEALIGLTQLALITLAGLPILVVLVVVGYLDYLDVLVLLVLPFTWGAITGIGLSVWAYEPAKIRRWAERFLMGGILVYLIVGVLAGENLKRWVDALPTWMGNVILQGFVGLHTHNPFGVLRHWFSVDAIWAWERMLGLELVALLSLGLLLVRAAWRLEGHFHELHYQPIEDVSKQHRSEVGIRPLSWWAIKRVAKYSGRSNLWLAGGFCLLYALYLIAGSSWPSWMGKRIFQMCDNIGGVAGLTTGLVLLAAVPAAFQYGLWDSSVQDRCRRLELLLLTRLDGTDYWNAAAASAWSRGRGYFATAFLLWGAAWIAGRMQIHEVVLAISSAVLLWGLYFALGFRAFARGMQANGLGMGLTLGLPMLVIGLSRSPWPGLQMLLPPGMVYATSQTMRPSEYVPCLAGACLAAGIALLIARRSLRTCIGDLREWYDLNHGNKVMN